MSPNYITWGVAAAAVAVFLWKKIAPVKGCTDIDEAELEQLLKQQKGAKVLDVRTPAEYRLGHIPGALSRPLGQLEKWAGEFKNEQSLFLVCASGSRSKSAARRLVKKGFGNLFNLKGGMARWTGPVK